MTNLHTIIGRINQRLYSKHVATRTNYFPKDIHGYHFEKALKFGTSLSGYSFALYKKGKKRALGKAYFGIQRNHLYFGLQNEIRTYKLLATKNSGAIKINKIYFDIPKIIDVVRDGNKLIALMEEKEGSTKIEKRNLVETYEGAIEYIKKLRVSKELKQSINNVSRYYMLFTSPVVLLFALHYRPKLRALIFKNYLYFIMNWKITSKYKWNTLIHRDLRASLLKTKNRVFVIDWQLASTSNDLLEFAQLFITYFENNGMGINFDGFRRINKLTYQENILFKVITIYVLLTEIGFVKTKKYADEKSLLEKILDR